LVTVANPITEFLRWLSPGQEEWFRRQPMTKQLEMANGLTGGGRTADEIVRENGGPADERSTEGFGGIK
jgi:hypothetical protein